MSPATRERAAKGAVLVASVVLLASMGGGFLLLPALVPAQLWAARRSGPVGRFPWSLLPAVSAGVVSWGLTYLAIGEEEPVIWLVPSVAAVAVYVVAVSASRSRSVSPSSAAVEPAA